MHRFPSFDELHRTITALARDHSARVELHEVGKSRGGRGVLLASVGKGRKNVLVLGGPHANEPTGFLTVIHLARLAAKHPDFAEGLDVTWHFVPCMDPDSMVLGEGWYGAPRTIRNYYGNFYRPAFVHQPEWSFPVDGGFDRPLPETRALMSVIDDLRPKFVYSLHSADFTGHHFMVTSAAPALVSDIEHAMARRGLPVHTAPSDGGTPIVGRGVFLMPAPPRPDPGGQVPFGASSIHYAQRHGALGIVPETPMWHCPQFADTGSSGRLYAALFRAAADGIERDRDFLAGVVDRALDDLPQDSPLFVAVAEGLPFAEQAARQFRSSAEDPTHGRPATVAEQYQLLMMRYTLSLRPGGMLLQLLEGAGAKSEKEVRNWFDRRCARMRSDFPGRALDLRELTALQMEVGLAAVRGL
ncbi:M14 family zinc carboxypeptidase [Streptomyces sp. NPDC048057]|uniref:M14 family zinc carboxypeptidase n=1 Tax=Streptomyces sp. NPDC048057 TaxID=3155628 RepID=UPI0033D11BCA